MSQPPPIAAAPTSDPLPNGDEAGRLFPPRPLVGVGVVVLDGDRVLLVRRAKPPRAGEWSLPGGLQRLGETVAEAGRREVMEETGLAVAIAGLVEVVDLIDRDDAQGGVRWHYTLIDLHATCTAGREPVAGSDAAAAAWHAAGTLPALGLWPETLRVIARARALHAAGGGAGQSPGGSG